MNPKTLSLFLVSLIALFASFAYSMFTPTPTAFLMIPLTIMIIVFFLFGALGFGLLSFVPHIFLGLTMGEQKNALMFIYLLPIILATYAGIKLGTTLLNDFNKKEYFLGVGKSVATILAIALIIAVAIEFALPLIQTIDLWPKDLLGMSVDSDNAMTTLKYLAESAKMK